MPQRASSAAIAAERPAGFVLASMTTAPGAAGVECAPRAEQERLADNVRVVKRQVMMIEAHARHQAGEGRERPAPIRRGCAFSQLRHMVSRAPGGPARQVLGSGPSPRRPMPEASADRLGHGLRRSWREASNELAEASANVGFAGGAERSNVISDDLLRAAPGLSPAEVARRACGLTASARLGTLCRFPSAWRWAWIALPSALSEGLLPPRLLGRAPSSSRCREPRSSPL